MIASELRSSTAPFGVWAVLGNHDWWLDAPRVERAFESVGIPVLEDSAVSVGRGACRFWVAGVSDFREGRHDVAQALARAPDSEVVIAVTHNPDVFPMVPARVSLTIAGHTHGGQVYVPLVGRPVVPSNYGQRYAGDISSNRIGTSSSARASARASFPFVSSFHRKCRYLRYGRRRLVITDRHEPMRMYPHFAQMTHVAVRPAGHSMSKRTRPLRGTAPTDRRTPCGGRPHSADPGPTPGPFPLPGCKGPCQAPQSSIANNRQSQSSISNQSALHNPQSTMLIAATSDSSSPSAFPQLPL